MGQKHAFGVLPPQRLNGPMRYIVSLEASRRDASTEPYSPFGRSLLMEQSAKRWAGWGPQKGRGEWGLSRDRLTFRVVVIEYRLVVKVHMPSQSLKSESGPQASRDRLVLSP